MDKITKVLLAVLAIGVLMNALTISSTVNDIESKVDSMFSMRTE